MGGMELDLSVYMQSRLGGENSKLLAPCLETLEGVKGGAMIVGMGGENSV